MSVLNKIFGSRNDRLIKDYGRIVKKVNEHEPRFKGYDDATLREQTVVFRKRLDDGESLDALLPEAFAAVREAAVRTLGLRHYDVQLIGGMVLNEGKIAEMRTGEGKTLMSTLAAYLNALANKGVHVVTVNDYLAVRDADWMRPVYEFLGLTVASIQSGQSPDEKRAAYAADITYGTNNEFSFDYLRDHLIHHPSDRMQRGLGFAVIDEVDSILIDESRTPIIISGRAEDNTDMFVKINQFMPKLTVQQEEDGPGDFSVDEKTKQVYLTEEGHQAVEQLFQDAGLIDQGASLYDANNIQLMHMVKTGLRAHYLFQKDVDYIVKQGDVIIVDEFTGRTMEGRRWSDGLHQAVEAKERVPVKEENITLAVTSYQNFFRLYDKLSGMTGTADTEAFEFQDIYDLEVVVIPTHKPMIRDDRPDLVYLTQDDKFNAIVEEVTQCRERGQPVLVGTASIDASERLSNHLKKLNIQHNVLNAKQHQREASVIAGAGSAGAVTIATNMAGRGTDIVLGGKLEEGQAEAQWQVEHDRVLQAGGLHIIGTERHESRRIDNQLRGRSGRQGDPGSSRFYLSLEDDLMRVFGNADRTKSLLQRVGMKPGEAIESKMLSRQIEKAQKRVESYYYDSRKQLLEYDDVANEQRTVVYQERNDILDADSVGDSVTGMRHDVINELVMIAMNPEVDTSDWNVSDLNQQLESEFGFDVQVDEWLEAEANLDATDVATRINKELDSRYQEKTEQRGGDLVARYEKGVMLQVLDRLWREHLTELEALRQGIHLRGYAQKNPKQEYKREAFDMFSELLDRFKYEVSSYLCLANLPEQGALDQIAQQHKAKLTDLRMRQQRAQAATVQQQSQANAAQPEPFVREDKKVGRNEPCPCGSGKKYKRCHGRIDSQASADSNEAA